MNAPPSRRASVGGLSFSHQISMAGGATKNLEIEKNGRRTDFVHEKRTKSSTKRSLDRI
jgi:hypothetical protein